MDTSIKEENPSNPSLVLPLEGREATAQKREMTFGESINFNTLFRIKGKPNLWFQVSYPQKNGMVGMVEFGVDNPVTVHKDNLECLGQFVFYKNTSDKIRLGEVFDNLEKFTLEELGTKKDIELLEIMCPDYDAERFKPYHGEKVMKWYFEIKEKLEKKRKEA